MFTHSNGVVCWRPVVLKPHLLPNSQGDILSLVPMHEFWRMAKVHHAFVRASNNASRENRFERYHALARGKVLVSLPRVTPRGRTRIPMHAWALGFPAVIVTFAAKRSHKYAHRVVVAGGMANQEVVNNTHPYIHRETLLVGMCSCSVWIVWCPNMTIVCMCSHFSHFTAF